MPLVVFYWVCFLPYVVSISEPVSEGSPMWKAICTFSVSLDPQVLPTLLIQQRGHINFWGSTHSFFFPRQSQVLEWLVQERVSTLRRLYNWEIYLMGFKIIFSLFLKHNIDSVKLDWTDDRSQALRVGEGRVRALLTGHEITSYPPLCVCPASSKPATLH